MKQKRVSNVWLSRVSGMNRSLMGGPVTRPNLLKNESENHAGRQSPFVRIFPGRRLLCGDRPSSILPYILKLLRLNVSFACECLFLDSDSQLAAREPEGE